MRAQMYCVVQGMTTYELRMNVLLLDEGFVSGAQTALGLRRAGCRVTVLAATGVDARCASGGIEWRMVRQRVGQDLLAVIEAHIATAAFDVIYPTTEPLHALLAGYNARWTPRVVLPYCASERRIFEDKRAMSARVAADEVAVPDEHRADTPRDIDAAVARLGLPVVVKGTRGRGGSATIIASSVRDAYSATSTLRARGGTPFLQRYVRGRTCLVGGLFDRGRALRLYAGEKTRQFPARTGPAAEIRSVHDVALTDAALRAFAAARVHGLASADFVRDESGGYWFLELNPRPWGCIAAARDAGVDLFEPLSRLWRGEAIEPDLTYRANVVTSVFPLSVVAGHPTLRDALRLTRLARQEPRLVWHLTQRAACVAYNWRPQPRAPESRSAAGFAQPAPR